MAYIFGDSFDLYATPANGIYYWDTCSWPDTTGWVTPGRFPPGQALVLSDLGSGNKIADGNYKIHKFNMAIYVPSTSVVASGNGAGVRINDGGNIQCEIHFNYQSLVFYVWSGAWGLSTGTSNLV